MPPLVGATTILREFLRAQPFNGDNTRVALIVASVFLSAHGLPVLALRHGAALELSIAATAFQTTLENVEDLVWSEALERIELSAVVSPRNATLSDEHQANLRVRARASVTLLMPQLPAHALVVSHELPTERLRAAIRATRHQRRICPHLPIVEARWPGGYGRDHVVVAGVPGRGVANAASMHFFVDPDVPASAPAILLVPDEPSAERAARVARWFARVIPPV